MQINKKRIGFLLAFATTLAALLLEPVNGPRRRARIRKVLEPAGRPIQAMRDRISGKDAEQAAELPEHPRLIDRLHHVAIRAQGQIDTMDEPAAHADGHHAHHAARAESSAPRKRRKAKVSDDAGTEKSPAPRKRRKPDGDK